MRTLVCLLLLSTVGPALAEEMPRPVISEIVTADPTRQRSFAGTIEAGSTSVLAFQTIGRVASIEVAEGDVVKRGQALASLDQITLDEDVRVADAALASAEATAQAAAQQLIRAQELAKKGVASAERLEGAQRANDTAIAQAAAAKADLARAKDAARFGTLTAPMDGVILSTSVDPGTVVSAGTQVLTLAALQGREAVIDVPSDYLALLPSNATFTIQSRSPDIASLTGRLRLIEPVADASVRGRRIRVRLPDDAPSVYRIGSLISATLDAEADALTTLPASAVVGQSPDTAVWRIDPATRAVKSTPVTLGKAVGDRVIVTSGVSPGDEIMVRGVHSLEDGQVVGERIE